MGHATESLAWDGRLNGDMEPESVQMLRRFCDALDAMEIRYVIVSGCANFPRALDSDIDIVVSRSDFEKLPALFARSGFLAEAELVQEIRHEISATYFVFAKAKNGNLAFLVPDIASDFRRNGRLWLKAERFIESRNRGHNGFWVPSPQVEFEYYLIKKIGKASVSKEQMHNLARLYSSAPEECRKVAERLVRAHANALLQSVVAADDSWFNANSKHLGKELEATRGLESCRAPVGS
jgi:hypothetical protein